MSLNLENTISHMMSMNVKARLWHWMTDSAQHHVTYEQFLTQNETFTDRLMESALGNDMKLNMGEIGVRESFEDQYSHEKSRETLKNYRAFIQESKNTLASQDLMAAEELTTIMDDVLELCSKTLYLLKLR